jgi:hypothetical protein
MIESVVSEILHRALSIDHLVLKDETDPGSPEIRRRARVGFEVKVGMVGVGLSDRRGGRVPGGVRRPRRHPFRRTMVLGRPRSC